jgi:hypothetical protein
MHTRTPPAVDKHITRLIARVAAGAQPVYLDVRPEAGAVPGECFANVAAKVAASGGSIVYGWQLWEWPHVLVEAEFHAVWRAPDGLLHEITPKHDGDERILFVPDPRRTYGGTPLDNVRMAVRDDLLVHHFIAVAEEMVRVRIRSGREVQPGMVSMPAHEIEPLMELQALIGHMLSEGRRANDLCACGSGSKYKRCHGTAIANVL